MDTNILYERYQRQMILKGFGETAQLKLFKAKVLVVGGGGLGCPALQYLAAAGIGTIAIIDDDVVSISNLHRQVLYSMNDIGLPKALTAATYLRQLNPDIGIISYKQRLNTSNAISIFKTFDLIIDGSDNFATRYLVNDACVLTGKPFIYGAVSQFEGQLAVFNINNNQDEKAVNYRDIFPVPPNDNEALNCAEAGVLGVLPGIIGTMMATEAIKYFTGIGKVLANRLLTYNVLTNQVYEMELVARNDTYSHIPADENAFQQMNYDWLCSAPVDPAEISFDTFNDLLNTNIITVVDVREPGEKPVVTEFRHLAISYGDLKNNIDKLYADTIVLFCQSGKRSKQAAKELSNIIGRDKKVYSLHAGIINWKQHQLRP